MMNPLYVETRLRAHRDRLLEEAAVDRLLKEAHAGRPATRDMLAARAGDLLLTWGLWLKRRSASASALVPDVTPQTASVITYRLSERFWQQILGPRPPTGKNHHHHHHHHGPPHGAAAIRSPHHSPPGRRWYTRPGPSALR